MCTKRVDYYLYREKKGLGNKIADYYVHREKISRVRKALITISREKKEQVQKVLCI